MEKKFTIDTADKAKIYCMCNEPERKTDTAIILIHGLTGHMHEHFHLGFARYFAPRGCAVFRFNQYDNEPGARRLDTCTIQTHVDDTRSVLKYVRSAGYTKIALVGHSLGGPIAICAADDALSGILLWDPTATPSERIKEWALRDPQTGVSYLCWQMKILLGEAWIKDAQNFPNTFEFISTLKVPIKIIAAELGRADFGERYHRAIKQPHAYTVIPGASHCFVEEGVCERLYAESAVFLANIFKIMP